MYVGRANLVHFRKDTFNLVKEPKAVVSNPENITLEHGFDVSDVFTHKNKYCNAQNKLVRDGLNITNARIKIFQRTGTIMLRKFVNLDEVVQLAQEYTTRPIEVLTTNATTSVQEQIEMFNDYDVLITAHGSHLANGLFTMHPETKVCNAHTHIHTHKHTHIHTHKHTHKYTYKHTHAHPCT